MAVFLALAALCALVCTFFAVRKSKRAERTTKSPESLPELPDVPSQGNAETLPDNAELTDSPIGYEIDKSGELSHASHAGEAQQASHADEPQDATRCYNKSTCPTEQQREQKNKAKQVGTQAHEKGEVAPPAEEAMSTEAQSETPLDTGGSGETETAHDQMSRQKTTISGQEPSQTESLHEQTSAAVPTATEAKTKEPRKVTNRHIDTSDRGTHRKRPDSTGTPQDHSRKKSTQQGRRVLDLVTWSSSGVQYVGLEINPQISIKCVCYAESNTPLCKAERSKAKDNSTYLLERLEPVVVETQDTKIPVNLQSDEILLFKMHGERGGQGRRVRLVSRGKYLLVCPESVEVGGQVSRIRCNLSGYTAYAFEASDDLPLPAVVLPSGTQYVWKKTQAYVLEGNIFCSPADMRPFYLGQAPTIIASEAFKAGTTVVVGIEGRKSEERPRVKKCPTPGTTRFDLKKAFAEEDCDWVFVRIYENDDILLESLDFVLLMPVKSISVTEHPTFPGAEGHIPVQIKVTHDENVSIDVDGPFFKHEAKGQTVIEVPPDPNLDKVNLQVRTGRNKRPVIVPVVIDRVWYGFGDAHNKSSEWYDKPLELSYEDFPPTTGRAVWIKLPLSLNFNRTPLLVGFEEHKAKKYLPPSGGSPLVIPLSDFYDQPEIAAPGHGKVHLWLWHGNFGGPYTLATIERRATPRTYRACGRSKNVYALARMSYPGKGTIICDGIPLENFCRKQRKYTGIRLIHKVTKDPQVAKLLAKSTVTVATHGGKVTSVRKCKAIAHSIAKVLERHDPSIAPRLRSLGLGGAKPRKSKFVELKSQWRWTM